MKLNINKVIKPCNLLQTVAEVLEVQNKSKGFLYAHDDILKTISEIDTNTGDVTEYEISIITHGTASGVIESVKLRKK